MATRNFVPRANNEGSIGTSAKNWNNGYFNALNVTGSLGITDSSTKAATTNWVQTLLNSTIYHNAGAHNAIYRGKDLTSYFNNGGMSTAISAGTFNDIYPGDYITKSVTINGTTYSNVKWIIGDLDYHLHRGDTETTKHHVLVFPETNIGTAVMNDTNVITDGYVGSKMWTTTIPLYATGIANAFGNSHVLSHRELLSNASSTSVASAHGAGHSGGTTNWAWTTVTVNIFNEAMVYGCTPVSSSMFDTGECNTQVAAMRHDKSKSFTRNKWCWLRAASYSALFCGASNFGSANNGVASASGGVRPYFLLT